MDYYLNVLRKYATFTGRARRKEYWMFVLISFLISIVIGIIDGVLGLQIGSGDDTMGILGLVYALAILIPSIAVGVRRLHDTDRSGWWMFIGLIPILGAIVLIVFAATEGTKGVNKYGSDPKQDLAHVEPSIPTQPTPPTPPTTPPPSETPPTNPTV